MSTTKSKSKASITAYSVAHAVRIAGNLKEYQHMVSSDALPLLEYFLSYHQKKQNDLLAWAVMSTIGCLPYAIQNWLASKLIMKNYVTAISMRKHYIEDNVRRFIDTYGDDSQILVFGGGYDTMPVRLSLEFPNTMFFESDRGETRNNKMEALNNLRQDSKHPLYAYAKKRSNLKFLDIDVADETFKTQLADVGFSFDKPTLFVCEGLTMYLSEQEVADLLTMLHSFDNPNKELAISFLESVENANKSWVSTFFRNRTNEDYRLSFLPQGGLDFLNKYSFEANYSINYSQLVDLSDTGISKKINNVVTQFITTPVDYKPKQAINEIDAYPLGTPRYLQQ